LAAVKLISLEILRLYSPDVPPMTGKSTGFPEDIVFATSSSEAGLVAVGFVAVGFVAAGLVAVGFVAIPEGNLRFTSGRNELPF